METLKVRVSALRFLVFLAGLIAGTLVVQPASAFTSRESGDTLTVLFTAETRGNLTPCACPKAPLGGLARRVAFLREIASRRSVGGLSLTLDSGGFLPEGSVPLRAGPDVAERYVRLLLDGLAQAGVQATAVDRGELSFLRKIAPRETARLARSLLQTDPPAPGRFISWNKRRIAILALAETLSDSLVIAAGVTARAQADLLVVLARADSFTGRRLARLSRADLVLLAYGSRPTKPIREGPCLLVGCGSEGREVGEIRLISDPESPPGLGGLTCVSFTLHPMDVGAPEDPGISDQVSRLLREAGPDAFAGATE